MPVLTGLAYLDCTGPIIVSDYFIYYNIFHNIMHAVPSIKYIPGQTVPISIKNLKIFAILNNSILFIIYKYVIITLQ